MKKLYQTNWHGIEFISFAKLNEQTVADPDFYQSFYLEFFRRYSSWEELDPVWLAAKDKVADLIFSRIQYPGKRILSIGCGLGIVEKRLIERGVTNLDATETTAPQLLWISELMGKESLFLGMFPGCIPADRRYDLIYMSAVDYCFDDAGFSALLRDVHSRLEGGGRCLVVSGSFDPGGAWRGFKYRTRMILHSLRILGARQLWGYLRTRKDYFRALQSAGFEEILDGLTPEGTYWAEGRKHD